MKIRICRDCGIEMETPPTSSKARCEPCRKRYNREKAHRHYLSNVENGKIHGYRAKARDYMNNKYQSDPTHRLFIRSKDRAKREGLEFNLEREDIVIPDFCPVLGTPFEFKTYYTESLDRIDNRKGYVKGNIQVISHKANAMKNSATPEELLKFAEWVLREYSD